MTILALQVPCLLDERKPVPLDRVEALDLQRGVNWVDQCASEEVRRMLRLANAAYRLTCCALKLPPDALNSGL